MAKINMTQQSASSWSRALNTLNEAQVGQIAITYKDNQGSKRTGYIDLFDIEVEIGKNRTSFGVLIDSLVKAKKDLTQEFDDIKQGFEILQTVSQLQQIEIDSLKQELKKLVQDIYPDRVIF